MHATQSLMAEHQTILRTLACLEQLARDERRAEEPAETFLAIVDFLRNYADRLHHGKEEALLFPTMEARGMSADQGPTAAMRHEHEVGRALVRRMATIAEAGDTPFDRNAFAEPALEFVELLRSHIAKEDHILFPMAEQMLSGSELHQLGIAYENSEAADFEPGTHERYETWALELAHRLDIRQETFVVRPACH